MRRHDLCRPDDRREDDEKPPPAMVPSLRSLLRRGWEEICTSRVGQRAQRPIGLASSTTMPWTTGGGTGHAEPARTHEISARG